MEQNNNYLSEKDFESVSKAVLKTAHRFSHKAMATEFEIFICHDERDYAAQAAQEAFSEIDRLELALSRFIENSDVYRINNLQENQTTRVGLDCFHCLQQCEEIYKQTGGAFDITIGNLWQTWLNKDKTLRHPHPEEVDRARENTGMKFIRLNAENYTVQVLRSPISIDLGGFGKGYALDKIVEIFMDWEIEQVLIHGGTSSVLALDPPSGIHGWPVTLTNPFSKQVIKKMYLHRQAVSGSGLQKGRHVIDPRSGQPVQPGKAAWAVTENAALSDALSTAFLVMSKEEIEEFCERNMSQLLDYYIVRDESLKPF